MDDAVIQAQALIAAVPYGVPPSFHVLTGQFIPIGTAARVAATLEDQAALPVSTGFLGSSRPP